MEDTTIKSREEGYYWVKCKRHNLGVWDAAYYQEEGEWVMAGTIDITFKDSDMSEINEIKILTPDEAKNNTDSKEKGS